jgi:exonuclease SbcC
MVTLLSLEASNFKRLSLQHPLEFGKGLTLIAGQNESGKSTILDAILFALFTRTIRPSTRPRNEDILQYGTNKLIVRLLFTVEGRTYLVERRIYRNKPSEAVLSERLPNGSLKAIATQVNSVNNQIAKLLGGLSFNEIISSNVVAQKELNKIVALRLGDRKAVINAFLNLDSFTEADQKLAEDKRGIEGTPTSLGTLPVAKQRLEALQRELQDWNAKRKELEDTQANQTDLQKKTDESQKKYEKTHDLFTKFESYQKELTKKNQIATEIQNKNETLDGIKKQIGDLETKQKDLASLTNESKKYERINELSTAIDQLSRKADDLQGKQVQLQTREKSPPITQDALQRASQEIQRHPGAIGIQQAQRIRKSSRTTMILGGLLAIVGVVLGVLVGVILFALVAAGIIGLIYATMQNGKASALTTQHADYLGKMQSYEDQRKIYADYESALSTLRVQVSEARKQLLQDINRVSRYQEIASSLKDPLQTVRTIKNSFEEEKTQFTILSNTITQLQRDLKNRPELEKQQKTLSGQIQELQKQNDALILPELPEGIAYSNELLANTKTADQNLHDAIVKNLEHIKNMKEAIGKLTKFVEEKEEIPHQTEEQEKNVRRLERTLRVVNDARTGLDKTSESLRTRVKPSVESYMRTFLPSVTMNRYKTVRLDDDYRLFVWDTEASEYRPREVFSGGTEDQLLLVMRLAFALALTPEARGTRPDFLFLDEPLGSSDEVRRVEIMQLLKTELAQYFKQIVLVSHVQGLEQDVDHIVRLEAGRITEQT